MCLNFGWSIKKPRNNCNYEAFLNFLWSRRDKTRTILLKTWNFYQIYL